MRIGIVLTVTFNLPLQAHRRAPACALDADGSGDIALTLQRAATASR